MRYLILTAVFMTACGSWTLRSGRQERGRLSRPEMNEVDQDRIDSRHLSEYGIRVRALAVSRTDISMDQALVLSLIEQARGEKNQKAEGMLWEKYRALEKEKKKIDLAFLDLACTQAKCETRVVAWVSSAE